MASSGPGYRLELKEGDSIDVLDLEQNLPLARAAIRRGAPESALSLLNQLGSRSDEPLADLAGAAFVDEAQRRLVELLGDRSEVLARALLDSGDGAEAIEVATKARRLHPYREGVHILLAEALASVGRAADALDALTECRSRLRDDLGLDASPAVGQAELDVLLHRQTSTFAAVESTGEPDGIGLFGRGPLVAEAIHLINATRFVTLVGAGGIGKTTAAEMVSAAWSADFDGRVRFVSLEDAPGSDLIALIGRSVGTSPNTDASSSGEVIDRLISDVELLVLDSCEQLVGEIATFVEEVRSRGSSIRILATSRRPIGTKSEHVLPVPPLGPDASRKMIERRMRQSHREPADVSKADMRDLAESLDGHPLAIELACANLRSFSVADLVTRLRTGGPTLSGDVGGPARHQSIASIIAASTAQLSSAERDLLVTCALFPQDFDLSALEYIAGSPVSENLHRLVELSLIEVAHSPGAARFRVLVPIRSEIRSGAASAGPAWEVAFLSHYRAVAADALSDIKQVESNRGVSRLAMDLGNISHAFELAAERKALAEMSSLVGDVGLANGISSAVGATTHLQKWCAMLRTHLESTVDDDRASAKGWEALSWGLYGSGDGEWYRRWETAASMASVETLAMGAIARFSRGLTSDAWDDLKDLDIASTSDPYLRAMLCGVGAVIAFENGAAEGDALTAVAVVAATERPSRGAAFFAALARSTQAFVHGDVDTCVGTLTAAVEAIDGHGLLTLENMGRAALAMTAGLMLGEIDPVHLLDDLLDRYLEQHSLDPASVAMALDVAALRLDQAGQTLEAATLAGLLDRLGLSMAILRPLRVKLDEKVSCTPAWARARAAAHLRTTFDVLQATRQAIGALHHGEVQIR